MQGCLMTNKWILGSTLSTLLGVMVAAVYLVLIQPKQDGTNLPHYHAEWILWFFLVMVLLSMLLNLSVLIAPPTQWFGLLTSYQTTHHQLKRQRNQHQIQLFMQQQQLQLQRLTSQADIYLWTTPSATVLVQFAVDGMQPAGISEMRQLFRWMLAHQCRHGFYLSLQAADLQAEIFAKEAGIVFVDVLTLQKLQSATEV